MLFIPDQAIAIVSGCEAVLVMPLVLKDSLHDVSGYTDVEGVAAAGHNVCVVVSVGHGTYGMNSPGCWTVRTDTTADPSASPQDDTVLAQVH